MAAVELCCGSLGGNADPSVVLFSLGVFILFVVFLLVIRGQRSSFYGTRSKNSLGRTLLGTRPTITLKKTLIDGQQVAVIDQARVAQLMESLKGPGAAGAVLSLNSPVWAELNAALSGASNIDPNGPFPVITRVRSALLTGQLDSARSALSDQLYERLNTLPPVSREHSAHEVLMVTHQSTADDPNRVVVRVAGSAVIPGAIREDWVLVRAPQGSLVPAQPAQPAATPTACPYCGAQLDAGSTRCRFCGMEATMPPPTTTPAPVPSTGGWIVEDITAANPQAA